MVNAAACLVQWIRHFPANSSKLNKYTISFINMFLKKYAEPGHS